MPETLSISINPQLFLINYPYAKQFQEITGINLKEEDIFNRNQIYNKIKNESKSKHIIIVNSESEHDYYYHVKPLAESYGIKLRYGLNTIENLLIWVYQASGVPEPHTSFETKYLLVAMDEIFKSFNSNNFNFDKCNKLAILINEFWKDLYSHKKYINILEKKHSKDIFVLKADKIIAKNLKRNIFNLQIKSETNFSNHTVCEVEKNSSYTIVIENIKVLNNNVKKITYGLYDFQYNERIKYFTSDIIKNAFYVNFMTGENVDGIKVIIYAGECGKTSDNIICIGKISIYQQNLLDS